MDKLLYFQRVEELKSRLPRGLVPIILTKWPHYTEARVKNALALRSTDFEILERLEEIDQFFNPKPPKK